MKKKVTTKYTVDVTVRKIELHTWEREQYDGNKPEPSPVEYKKDLSRVIQVAPTLETCKRIATGLITLLEEDIGESD